MPLLAALVAAVVVSLAALKYFALPFSWIAVCWAADFIYVALFSRSTAVRLICLDGAVILLGFGLAEVVVLLRPKATDRATHYEGTGPARDPWLGSAARPSSVMRSWETVRGKLVYDVRYTTDSLGLRVSPAVAAGHSGSTVLFFGDSFTYGHGLNDDATLPYQVGIASHGAFRILNFGYEGYGAHQMLSAVEHGLVARVVGHDSVRVAIYEASPHHVIRAVGEVPFQRHAPRYRIAADGCVYFAGHFDDSPDSWGGRIRAQLEKSALYRFWIHYPYEDGRFTDADLRLYVGIVARSRDILTDQYPGARFEVLLWRSAEGRRERRIAEALARVGIRVHRVQDILPGFDGYVRGTKYRLSPMDNHPDSVANAILANYVVSQILR